MRVQGMNTLYTEQILVCDRDTVNTTDNMPKETVTVPKFRQTQTVLTGRIFKIIA